MGAPTVTKSLHMGHVRWRWVSHGRMHPSWKAWLQGRIRSWGRRRGDKRRQMANAGASVVGWGIVRIVCNHVLHFQFQHTPVYNYTVLHRLHAAVMRVGIAVRPFRYMKPFSYTWDSPIGPAGGEHPGFPAQNVDSPIDKVPAVSRNSKQKIEGIETF